MDRACSPACGFHFTGPVPPPAVIQQLLRLCSGSDVLRSFTRSTSELHPRTASLIAHGYGKGHLEVFVPFFPQLLWVCPCYEKAVLTIRADLDTSLKE